MIDLPVSSNEAGAVLMVAIAIIWWAIEVLAKLDEILRHLKGGP